MGYIQKETPVVFTEQTKNKIYSLLYKKAKSMGVPEKDIPSLIYHVDNLSRIVIDLYIRSEGKK